jgi:hypothetical protein
MILKFSELISEDGLCLGGGWFFCLWLQSAMDFVYIAIVGWFANYLG